MKNTAYTEEDLQLLCSREGLKYLLKADKPSPAKVLKRLKYERELLYLQAELIRLQNWVIEKGERILIAFEGNEFAGKGGAIAAFVEHLNPRSIRQIALPKPSEIEDGQWYFQRYLKLLPNPGEMVFMDRSWYNRAILEPVNGFCTPSQHENFMLEVNEVEKMLWRDGIRIIKIFLAITKKEQARRIESVRNNPLKRWQLSPVDENAQAYWDQYQVYKEKAFAHTHSEFAPWKEIQWRV